MVNIATAENALKTLYLGVLAEQLNTGVNPLLAKIEKTSADVWGKEVKKLAPYGLNGGVGAGSETGALPVAGENNYAVFTLPLKNFYGKIEISDKAVRASETSAGAFVNLLNAEMEGLLKASKFNFGRMLFGDGSGVLATLSAAGSLSGEVPVDSVRYITEGMTVDFVQPNGQYTSGWKGSRVLSTNRVGNSFTVMPYDPSTSAVPPVGSKVVVQNSYGNELTGLEAVFGASPSIYGLARANYRFLNPYNKSLGRSLEPSDIQEAVDYVEEQAGGTVDIIVSSYDVRRAYADCLALNRTNLDYMTLDGGYKAISYGGIPFVADRFVADGSLYALNSADFKLHQLCDWRWLEGESGNVLRQIPDKAVYTATLVKYADLLCERPMGQAKIHGITA
ncbi:MAG: phage major capsid protein [Clostridiaceae bacterium]|jgi:hypothetical protein|nr:phage major capsid protein [Clostridiaceae bacterium]